MDSKTIKAQGRSIKLTHLGKIFWPQEGYTKEDLINYYASVAKFILPYLKNRPVMLHRYPNGIQKSGFYQKEIGKCPSWIKTVKIKHENREITYPLIQDKATLLYLVNLGCIDFHPFLSDSHHLKHPNYLVFDLDPKGASFDSVIKTALAIHQILEEKHMRNFCKTSGGKGLHIFVPLDGRLDFDASKKLAKSIALMVQKQLPDLISLKKGSNQRQKKVLIDYSRNAWAQTMVSPYSVRPRPHAPVSMPLEWKEVKKGLNPLKFTLKTAIKRLAIKGDLFIRPI